MGIQSWQEYQYCQFRVFVKTLFVPDTTEPM